MVDVMLGLEIRGWVQWMDAPILSTVGTIRSSSSLSTGVTDDYSNILELASSYKRSGMLRRQSIILSYSAKDLSSPSRLFRKVDQQYAI